jgi:hypothetical protein
MERFIERIELYNSFIIEKKISVSSIPYYQRLIYENHKINKLLENNLMTPKLFSSYNDNYKWDISLYLTNIIWCCKFCFYEFSSKRPERTWDIVECPYCDKVLTHRTGGGQSDPFNYTYKYV